ncbi:acyl-CoA dehydrogenase family member 11-like isoform X2 [Centrocercus urophasianus]|uniref:acyl-CoA dehydrogenase family member 11-like isoform X2 n=1 Tax=Centrocercus urophasianus TaxID=9002 RepID=UPI001C64A3A2|nr:acyl-CoA dehydrogenase family member 11-like isoform X2 [Centrocercus urophasianus]
MFTLALCRPGATCRLRHGWDRCQACSCRGFSTTAGQGQQVGLQEKQVGADLEMPVARREAETLFQERPEPGNQYLEDALLRSYLEAHLPPKVLEEYDAWGQRVDHIVTCSAWKRMKEIAAEEGLIAEAYERRYSNWSRVHQAVKLYLFSTASGGFNCPLAMTDGAAKVIESLGVPASLRNAFDRLTSRDPRKFWTSGQWMTERRGGSDVGQLGLRSSLDLQLWPLANDCNSWETSGPHCRKGSHLPLMNLLPSWRSEDQLCRESYRANGTETVARKQPDGTYHLYGFKWFTSAADSDMALTLARIEDAEGRVKQGSGGLSLFFLRVRDEEEKLNGIQVQRLKAKLGTRQMATAELWLNGAKAELISAEGRGVASISNMLNITRIHNVIGAVASMRRMISLSRQYALKRVAFGKLLKDHPLHMQTIARMEVQTRGAFLLLMEMARLLGLAETNMASEQDQLLLRLLVPVAKLYTGKQASAVAIEAMESFGGQGYMEDTGLPVIVRDTLVLSIWEGTTNVLSLDVLRSLTKSRGQAMAVFFSTVQNKLESAWSSAELQAAAQSVQDAAGRLARFCRGAASEGAAPMELAARDFSYSLARIYAGALLIEHAARPGSSRLDVCAAQRWCRQELCPAAAELRNGSYSAEESSLDGALVYDGSPAGSRL